MSLEPQRLETRDVHKHFGGVAALSGASISANPGEITGLIGPNGAGKTTLFNVITGYLRQDSGSVHYGDRDLTHQPPNRIAMRGVVRTFQDVRVFSGMTGFENLEVGVRHGHNLDAALEMLKLAERTRGWPIPLDVPAGALSFGDQKVIAIARTLALGAGAVLLDEPASGLDEGSTEVLLTLLRSFKEQGKLVLLVEHNMGLVMSTCDRLFVLVNGTVLAQGSPTEIQAHRGVIDAYLGGGAVEEASEVVG